MAQSPDVFRDPRWLWAALWLWLGTGACYLLTAPGYIDLVDGATRYEVADNLLTQGSPLVSDTLLFAVRGLRNQRFALYPWGASIASMPFIALGSWLSHGDAESKQFAFTLTSVPYASATVALLFLIYGRLALPFARALRWALVFAFGSLLWPYAGSSFDQALQAFWLTLGVWGVVEAFARGSTRWACVSALGFFALTGLQETYCILAIGVLAVVPSQGLSSIRDLMRRPELWVIFAGVVLGVASLAWWNTWRFGRPFATGRFSAPHPIFGNPMLGVLGLLLSPAKSVLLYSPVYALGVFGLVRLARAKLPAARITLAVCAVQLSIVSSLAFWAGEWAWGPRYLVASLALVHVGAPFAFAAGERRAFKYVLAFVAVTVQLLGIAVDHQIYYFERRYEPYFWLDPKAAYVDSPLFARPHEIARVVAGNQLSKVSALRPGSKPFSMTWCTFGPATYEDRENPLAWMNRFLVFQVPRPWPLWSIVLPVERRPTPPLILVSLAVCAALVATLGLIRAETRIGD